MDRKNFTIRYDDDVDISQTVGFLEGKVRFCSFSELLNKLYDGVEPIQTRLTNKLTEYEGTEDRDKAARKVRNWMHGRNLPGNREELFKICFALQLDLKKTERLLGTTADNGIHYRNPRELIYGFCLKKGEDYPKARALAERLWGEPLPSGTLEYQETLRDFRGRVEPCCEMTSSIRNKFKRLETEEELEAFLKEYRSSLGFHHNTAYRKFTIMLQYLLFPKMENQDLPHEKAYSVNRVVEEYLRMGMPYDKKSSGYTRIQKEIKKHWPTAKTINEMYRRKMDVDRKTLLLLYLATEGMIVAEKEDRDSWAALHRRRIVLMLTECGMALLDLHSPFDYLIMQAIRREQEEDFMSLRMEWMLRKIFSGKRPAAYIGAEMKKH